MSEKNQGLSMKNVLLEPWLFFK